MAVSIRLQRFGAKKRPFYRMVAADSRAKRDGRTIRYVADMTGFLDLLAYLMEDCCNGRPELCRPVINAIACDC